MYQPFKPPEEKYFQIQRKQKSSCSGNKIHEKLRSVLVCQLRRLLLTVSSASHLTDKWHRRKSDDGERLFLMLKGSFTVAYLQRRSTSEKADVEWRKQMIPTVNESWDTAGRSVLVSNESTP